MMYLVYEFDMGDKSAPVRLVNNTSYKTFPIHFVVVGYCVVMDSDWLSRTVCQYKYRLL